MKKTRLAFLLAMLLICATMLGACGGVGGGKKWSKVLDGSLYEAETVATQKVEASDLSGKTRSASAGELILLTKDDAEDPYKTEYAVYNLLKNSVVYSVTSSKTTRYSITLDQYTETSYVNGQNVEIPCCAYFTVKTTTYTEKNGQIDRNSASYVTVFYDANGNALASVDEEVAVWRDYPFLKFDDIYFTADKEAGIVKVCEKDPLGKTPAGIEALGSNYYFKKDGQTYIFYDKNLKIVSSYILPGYASYDVRGGLVGEDKYLIQFSVTQDMMGDKYDVLGSNGMQKSNIQTQIINIKNGKVKDVKCDYKISTITSYCDDAEKRADKGLSDKVQALAKVYPIVDKQIDTAVEYYATISERGKIETLAQLNGFNVKDIKLINTNRWLVDTTDGATYLVDEKFEVIGDVSSVSAESFGPMYINHDGKLYDYNLNVVLDYKAEKLGWVQEFETAVLFNEPVYDEDTSVIIGWRYYIFNGQLNEITATKDVEKDNGDVETQWVKEYEGIIGDSCYAILDTTNKKDQRYKIYSCNGTEIANFSYNNSLSVSPVCTVDGQTLISVSTTDSETSITTTTYYIIK